MTEEMKIKTKKKILTGEVVSNKMQKTIVVRVDTHEKHGLYQKYVIKSKKFKAHDENDKCHVGDKVRIIECRPLSKDKHFRLLEVVKTGIN